MGKDRFASASLFELEGLGEVVSAPPNKPPQQSLDPAVPFADAKATSASSAAELSRYAEEKK